MLVLEPFDDDVVVVVAAAAAAAAVLGVGNPQEKTSSLKMPQRERPGRATLAIVVNLAASKTLSMP